MQLCILADALDVDRLVIQLCVTTATNLMDRAKQLDEELPFMTVEDLKKLNKVSKAARRPAVQAVGKSFR